MGNVGVANVVVQDVHDSIVTIKRAEGALEPVPLGTTVVRELGVYGGGYRQGSSRGGWVESAIKRVGSAGSDVWWRINVTETNNVIDQTRTGGGERGLEGGGGRVAR